LGNFRTINPENRIKTNGHEMQNRTNQSASFSKVLFWPPAAKRKREIVFESFDAKPLIAISSNFYHKYIGYEAYFEENSKLKIIICNFAW